MDTGYPWTVDQYQATPLPLTATRSERVEAMIGYAWNQTGSSYTWGGAGPYDQGFDCSGLVLQSLYSAGLDPQPIDVIKHAWPSYRTSQELYAYPRFQHVPLAQRQRGDLIFYTTSGTVTPRGHLPRGTTWSSTPTGWGVPPACSTSPPDTGGTA